MALLGTPAVAQETTRTPTTQPGSDVVKATGDPVINPSDIGTFDIQARDTSIAALLDMLSRRARVNIVTSPSVTGEVSVNLYAVTVPQALDAILRPNQLAYIELDNYIYVGTLEEVAANGPPPAEPVARCFRLNYITRQEALPAIAGLLGPDGAISEGPQQGGGGFGGGGSFGISGEFTEAGSDYIIVVDTPDNLAQMARVIEQIDIRPQQVLIEATILRATLNEDNRLGVDMTLLGGVDFENVSSTSSGVRNITTGNVPPNRFQDTSVRVSSETLGSFPGGGFTFGIIHNDMAAFIRALEEVTDVTVLAHPKVVTLNKQSASVIVGRRDGYITTTVTETAAVQQVEFLETGTQIQLRPSINPDGTVRLDVRPKDSNGGLSASNLPFEETTEAHAQLLIDDGNTVLIGGLFRERTVSSRTQLPLLGDVPLAGALFQTTSDQTVREEVIILLTVRVLDNSPEEQREMTELLADVERIRVGTRRGLMATGRERLAQAFYQEALNQAEAGHADRALLNVRMALHNQPRHLAALKLKENLLHRRLWEAESGRIRSFMLDALPEPDSEEPPEADLFGRPLLHEQLLRDRPAGGWMPFPGEGEDRE